MSGRRWAAGGRGWLAGWRGQLHGRRGAVKAEFAGCAAAAGAQRLARLVAAHALPALPPPCALPVSPPPHTVRPGQAARRAQGAAGQRSGSGAAAAAGEGQLGAGGGGGAGGAAPRVCAALRAAAHAQLPRRRPLLRALPYVGGGVGGGRCMGGGVAATTCCCHLPPFQPAPIAAAVRLPRCRLIPAHSPLVVVLCAPPCPAARCTSWTCPASTCSAPSTL